MVFIGSAILIVIGGLAMLGVFTLVWYPIYAVASFWWGLTILIVGLLGVTAARWVRSLGVGLFLIGLALIAAIFGAWWASWLIGIGAIIGIVTR